MADQRHRTGTWSIDLSDDLRHDAVHQSIHDALRDKLAATGETLARFDFGPPRVGSTAGTRTYDVMFRTGTPDAMYGETPPPPLDA